MSSEKKPLVPYSEDIGARLKKARVQAGLSQGQLAKELGYETAQVVSNWERGQQSPPFETLVKLCQILDIPKNDVIDWLMREHLKNYNKFWKQKVG